MPNKQKSTPQAGRQGVNGGRTGKTGQPGQGTSKSARRRRAKQASELVYAPTNVSALTRNRAAQMSGNGAVMIVTHREFISDVRGSIDYAVTGYSINPGQVSTFPWLSNIARNFEKYRFRKLRFVFESSVATFLSGMTMLAFDLDAADPAPVSKSTLMSYANATRANVWTQHSSSMPEQQPELYVRPGGLPAGTDVKTYDAGNLFFATSGESDDSVVGELYVEYTVELHVPQLAQDLTTQTAVFSGTGPGFTKSGSLYVATSEQYPADLSGRVAIQCQVGQRLLVTGYALTGAGGTVTMPTFKGSSGEIIGFRQVANGSTNNLAETVVQCNSLTTSTFEGGQGWFVLAPGTLVDVIFTINAWQSGLGFPVAPAKRVVTQDELIQRLLALEARADFDTVDSDDVCIG